ncbi:carboxymuconolactone decarboxylase family protein [Oceaniglobus indicus]|uniref:carboxymuconolactone decarboxylase family protein n=1 Tax=Oceaniglobus indicus TaxID=2047749 RepID=UPI000C19F27B|nr:carboxymuconolactone decarboxylase family protein [Oceaniglobus indicus]
MSTPKEQLNAAKLRMGSFAKATPDMMTAFSKVSRVATQAGAFDTGQRELIAVALSVAKGCDDCILYHVDAAKRQGASRDALIEVLEIAVEMGGGPAVMYAGRALNAWNEL